VDLLYFRLGDTAYAIALGAIADVAPAGPIYRVPLSPPAILGLTERRGRPIAVIDLAFLLDGPSGEVCGISNLLRLAGPLNGAAFLVPAAVVSGTGTAEASGHVTIDGRSHVLLDAEALVKRAAAFH
jgi:chemotaxis signal transduction protein